MKYFFLIVMLFFIGCNSDDKVSEEKLAHLYVDILVAEETYKTDIDSMNIAVDSLYKEYNISKELYLSKLEEYKYDEDTWDKFFDLAEEYLDTLKAIEARARE